MAEEERDRGRTVLRPACSGGSPTIPFCRVLVLLLW